MARKGREKNAEGRMRLGEHLSELRNRFFIALIAIAAASIGGFFLAAPVLELIERPIAEVAASEERLAGLNFGTVTGAFNLQMQIGVILGVVLTSPIWLYQILAFITPGLHKRERRYLYGFLGVSLPLFFAGTIVGWLVFPRIVTVFMSFQPADTLSALAASDYFGFAIRFFLSIGAGFVMPVLLVALNFAGILSAKGILSGWRWAIIGITIFTALVTPATEPMTMLFLALPIVALYFAAAGVAWLHDRRVTRSLNQMADGSQPA